MARRKKEWFDNESFWKDFYGSMFTDERIDSAAADVEKILALASPEGKRVLDLCCGPGRHTIALAKRNFRLTGVDKTRYLMNKARARARTARVKVEWVLEDMRDFERPDSFDLILCMFTSFGFFENRDDDLTVLRHMHSSLHRRGRMVIDVIGKEWLAADFTPTQSWDLPSGGIVITRNTVIDDWTRLQNDWILVRKGKAKTYRIHLNIYTGRELKDLMQRAGFQQVSLYGGLDGSPYERGSRRLVAVGRK